MQPALSEINEIAPYQLFGRIAGVQGLTMEVLGAQGGLSVGSRCAVQARNGGTVIGEVVGFRGRAAVMLPYSTLDGVGVGCRATVIDDAPTVSPDERWLGRVINANGEPLDGGAPLPRRG